MFNVRILVMLFLFVLIMGGGIVLQIFLSKLHSRWPGLALPLLHLVLAFIGSFGLMIYTGDILPILISFFLLAIPTYIYLLIYYLIRKRKEKDQSEELAKMNIQDL